MVQGWGWGFSDVMGLIIICNGLFIRPLVFDSLKSVNLGQNFIVE